MPGASNSRKAAAAAAQHQANPGEPFAFIQACLCRRQELQTHRTSHVSAGACLPPCTLP